MMKVDKRLEKIQAWSDDPNAYACLQPGLSYFDHPAGFLAYRKTLAGPVVLGNPIATKDEAPNLLADFLKKHPNSVFSYLSDDGAKALMQGSRKQMHFVNIGFERFLDLPYTQTFSSSVQGALKKAIKAGLKLTEKRLTELTAEENAHFQSINNLFLKSSPAGREVGFISRAMHFTEETDVRFFSIRLSSEPLPIGFCVLDPWYKNGKLERYQLHQFRLKPTKLWGVYFSVVALLMGKLQAEGVLGLSLGACAEINATQKFELPSSKAYNFCRDTSFRLAEYYHPLSNLSKNKLQFSGENLNRYLAAPHRFPLIPLIRFAKANNMKFLPKW